jgi:transcription elongation factor Elf1
MSQERQFTCSNCGHVTSEKLATVDEMGRRVLNCEGCHEVIFRKRTITARPLPDHLMKMPEARFNKRPV